MAGTGTAADTEAKAGTRSITIAVTERKIVVTEIGTEKERKETKPSLLLTT